MADAASDARSAPPASWWMRVPAVIGALLLIDLILIVIHCVGLAYFRMGLSSLWSVEKDHGYPELYQYGKELLGALCLGLLYLRSRQPVYLGWGLLFFYFMLDDGLRLHERAGAAVLAATGAEVTSLTTQLAELSLSAVVGAFIFTLLAIGYARADAPARRVSKILLILLAAMVFCAVVVDVIHGWVGETSPLRYALGVLEDGGEMVAMSAIAGYVTALAAPWAILLRRSGPALAAADEPASSPAPAAAARSE